MHDVISIDTRRQAESARREGRLKLSAMRENLLVELDPPVRPEGMTGPDVCDYFGISRSALLGVTRRYGSELRDVGYEPGSGKRHSVYSRRAMFHVGVLLRPTTSGRAKEIQQKMGLYRDPRKREIVGTAPSNGHRERCRGLLNEAYALAEAVQQQNPPDTWGELTSLDRYELQSLVVTLGALLPLDQSGLRAYLTEMSRPHTTNENGDAAVGLAMLVPAKAVAWEQVVGE